MLRAFKLKLASFLQWQAETGSRSTEILAEIRALRRELGPGRHGGMLMEADGVEIAAEMRKHRPGGGHARPYYYLGHGRGLTQLSTGHPFFVNTRDRGITTWIILGGVWETFVDDVLCALARPGGIFLDVGANQGYYSVKLGHLVGPAGAGFSFEPNPELYAVLADNVDINGLSARVRTFPLAAGDAPGRSVLHFGQK